MGKTSLLTSLLAAEDRRKAELPTISRFPGTTQGTSTWKLCDNELILYDTPGFLPGSRMGDHFTPETASRLLPEKKLQVKLWNLPADGAVLLGGLPGIWNQSPAARTLSFAGSTPPCTGAGDKRRKYYIEKAPTVAGLYLQERPAVLWNCFTVRPGEDLYISGCGWVAVRENPPV